MVRVNFLGDISFNDTGKELQFNFSEYTTLGKEVDFSISNIEALASIGEYNLLKKPRVTTDIASIDNLTQLDINLVTLAHNHVYDAKKSGFIATTKKLDELGISYIGAGLTAEDAAKPFIYENDGLKIGFLNYCTSDTNPSLPPDCEVYLNEYSLITIQKDVEKLKQKCDHIVLILHWGGKYEGGFFPERKQVDDAIFFESLGVSLIVGHHPHTLQPKMNINNMPVYFSLGNFVFFDVHFENKIIRLPKRRKKGGVLHADFSKEKDVQTTLFYSRQKLNKIQIKTFALTPRIRSYLYSKFYMTKIFWRIYNIKFHYINPIYYFIFVKEGGVKKYQNLNLNKLKKILWKR